MGRFQNISLLYCIFIAECSNGLFILCDKNSGIFMDTCAGRNDGAAGLFPHKSLECDKKIKNETGGECIADYSVWRSNGGQDRKSTFKMPSCTLNQQTIFMIIVHDIFICKPGNASKIAKLWPVNTTVWLLLLLLKSYCLRGGHKNDGANSGRKGSNG